MRHLYFIIANLAVLGLFHHSLWELAKLSFHNSLYSHFLLIPFVSLYILVKIRLRVFAETDYAVFLGVTVVAAGLLLYGIGLRYAGGLDQNDYLSLMMLSFLVCFIGSFIGVYGASAFRQALFPLLFLIFIIPVPSVILEPLVKILLIGSAETSYKVFQVLDIPIYRQGFVFELPGISVEVARQCSGIRSTLALIITSVLAGYLFLETGWRRIVLCICVFPITVFKNSLRIVTISLLASYVDPIFITNHWIHSAGGKPFFIFALLFMVPVLWLLRRSEEKGKKELTS
jgi:exosortase